MYQVFNPYTGEDLRSVVPSPFANLGLGMGDDGTETGTVTTGGGQTAVKHPAFVHFLHGHPQMASGLKAKRAQFVSAHPNAAARIKARRNDPTGFGAATTQPQDPTQATHPNWAAWLQEHPDKAALLKQWRAQWVGKHPNKAQLIQWLRAHKNDIPTGMGAFNTGILVGWGEKINTHGTPGPNSVMFPTNSTSGMMGLGDDTLSSDPTSWLDSWMISPSDIFGSGTSSIYNPPPTYNVGVVDSSGNVYNPSNPNNWWEPSSSGGSGSGLDAASITNTLLQDANSIAKIVLTPGGSYTMTGPGGQSVSYQGTGQPSSMVNIPGLTTATNSSWLLIAGAALIGIMIFSSR